jgi:nucleotide-binding universal stress UspA family protein
MTAILEYAKESGASYICMGTHGSGSRAYPAHPLLNLLLHSIGPHRQRKVVYNVFGYAA